MLNLSDYPIFNNHFTTLKETSLDDCNKKFMIESNLKVIDFDLVKREYTNSIGLSEDSATSVDAIILYSKNIILPNNANVLFIEFKNGKVSNRNLKDKLRDSLLLFCDITKTSISYSRENIDFIVVYNIEKNPLPHQSKKLQDEPSKGKITEYFFDKANDTFVRFDLKKYEKLYFKNIFTLTKDEFEEYLKKLNNLNKKEQL